MKKCCFVFCCIVLYSKNQISRFATYTVKAIRLYCIVFKKKILPQYVFATTIFCHEFCRIVLFSKKKKICHEIFLPWNFFATKIFLPQILLFSKNFFDMKIFCHRNFFATKFFFPQILLNSIVLYCIVFQKIGFLLIELKLNDCVVLYCFWKKIKILARWSEFLAYL